MIRGELNRTQYNALLTEVRRLEIPPQKRQRLLWRIAKHGIIVAAKRHQKQQRDPDGAAWAPRKRGKKKPMLKNLPKLIKIKEEPATQSVRLYLSGGNYQGAKNQRVSAGVVGYAHQNGMTATVTAVNGNNEPQPGNANKRQAKKLRSLDYRIMSKGKYKKAPSSYITSNLSHAQAGTLIRILQNRPIKKTWNIVLPSRVFLGVNDEEFGQIIMRQLQAINYG